MKTYNFYIIFLVFFCISLTARAQESIAYYTSPLCSNQNWTTSNDFLLWNEPYWWDATIDDADKAEEPVELCISVKDSCVGLNIEYLLFMDLDGDDFKETVVNSEQLGAGGLGWNQIRYNNQFTPNYTGGELRAFDERAVSVEQKYGFALEEIVTDSGKIAYVRFNTEAAPDSFLPVQLPHGKYRIQWIVTDSCSFPQVHDYEFTVKDCVAPVVNCNPPLTVPIFSIFGMVTVWADDFFQSATDNCTATNKIKIGLRKCGHGTGFPLAQNGNPQTNITFDCCDVGDQCVEVWAQDLSGNLDSCTCDVYIVEPVGGCDCFEINSVSGYIKTDYGDGITDVTVVMDGNAPFSPPFSFFDLSDHSGYYDADVFPLLAQVNIKPERKDNPLNGVTTYDLVLISKHILSLEPLLSPYKIIAADANKSGSITTFDIVELRKLILGIYTKLPNNDSWRFIDKTFTFPNANNPFETAFPEAIEIDTLYSDKADRDFIGIKVGDVNDTAVPNAGAMAPDRSAPVTFFETSDRAFQAGEIVEVNIAAAERLDGFQFTLLLHGLKPVQVVENENVTTGNFNMAIENAVAVSINGAQDFTLRFQAKKAGLLSEMLHLGEGVTRAEAYGREGLMKPVLRFDGRVGQGRVFELYPAQPNPFAMQTTISFYLPEASDVGLSVFDVTGRLLYSREAWLEAGMQQIILDKKRLGSDSGQGYYLLRAGRDVVTQKIAWF